MARPDIIGADALAAELTREAEAAGLIVARMEPHRCRGDTEFAITLYMASGRLWADGTHETVEDIRGWHIPAYQRYAR